MIPTLAISAVHFHDGKSSSVSCSGHAVPAGQPYVSVDFTITESDDRSVVLTEILTGVFGSYDELVAQAYQQALRRLASFGALAVSLQRHAQKQIGH